LTIANNTHSYLITLYREGRINEGAWQWKIGWTNTLFGKLARVWSKSLSPPECWL
jgi:hypothetical protein